MSNSHLEDARSNVQIQYLHAGMEQATLTTSSSLCQAVLSPSCARSPSASTPSQNRSNSPARYSREPLHELQLQSSEEYFASRGPSIASAPTETPVPSDPLCLSTSITECRSPSHHSRRTQARPTRPASSRNLFGDLLVHLLNTYQTRLICLERLGRSATRGLHLRCVSF